MSAAPPVFDSLPPALRRRLVRLASRLHHLERALTTDFPMADALSADPTIADRWDSTPEDHLLADFIAQLRAVRDTIADLRRPIPIDHDSAPPTAPPAGT
jgi:ubiquinone biosynthesis protein UbiJ